MTSAEVGFAAREVAALRERCAAAAAEAAALRGERLFRIPVRADGSVGDPASLFVGEFGRLRTVVVAPDGALWFTTSNRDGRGDPRPGDDRILAFRP